MDNLFNAQVHFNGGNPHLFKVQVDIMLKDLNDQLNEINQGLDPGDTRRVEYVWYKRPSLDEGRITFGRPEILNDDDVRSMFSIFCQHNMFPWIEMDATLPPEDILKSLILPQDYV